MARRELLRRATTKCDHINIATYLAYTAHTSQRHKRTYNQEPIASAAASSCSRTIRTRRTELPQRLTQAADPPLAQSNTPDDSSINRWRRALFTPIHTRSRLQGQPPSSCPSLTAGLRCTAGEPRARIDARVARDYRRPSNVTAPATRSSKLFVGLRCRMFSRASLMSLTLWCDPEKTAWCAYK